MLVCYANISYNLYKNKENLIDTMFVSINGICESVCRDRAKYIE